MSKMPIRASSCVDRIAEMPTSWHAAIKCVPMSPLVLAPQMKNVPARIQNAGVRDATAKASSGGIALAGVAGGPSTAWPYGASPTSAGRSRMKNHTITKTTAAAAATINAADRQLEDSTTTPSTGRKRSWPVALAADNAPQQEELPFGGHPRGDRNGGRHQREGAKDHAPQAPAIHDGGGEGADQSEQRDVDGDRRGDDRPAPAEFRLERHHEQAGCRPHARRDQHHDERDERDDPRVVDLCTVGIDWSSLPATAPGA